jgi:hypothetical protein
MRTLFFLEPSILSAASNLVEDARLIKGASSDRLGIVLLL